MHFLKLKWGGTYENWAEDCGTDSFKNLKLSSVIGTSEVIFKGWTEHSSNTKQQTSPYLLNKSLKSKLYSFISYKNIGKHT